MIIFSFEMWFRQILSTRNPESYRPCNNRAECLFRLLPCAESGSFLRGNTPVLFSSKVLLQSACWKHPKHPLLFYRTALFWNSVLLQAEIALLCFRYFH